MPRRILLFSYLALILLSAASFLGGQAPREKVLVATSRQLIGAIASDREILLMPGAYALDDAPEAAGRNAAWTTGPGKPHLVVRGAENLSLRAADPRSASMVGSEDGSSFVLSFESCRNLEIESVNFGHSVSGPCQAGVLSFAGCEGVRLSACLLYGSGAVGIEARDCSGLKVEDCAVSRCASGALRLSGAASASFSGCSFTDNQASPLISVQRGSGPEFRNCRFEDNRGDAFILDDGDGSSFVDCSFIDNDIGVFSEGKATPLFSGCAFAGNGFPDPAWEGD